MFASHRYMYEDSEATGHDVSSQRSTAQRARRHMQEQDNNLHSRRCVGDCTLERLASDLRETAGLSGFLDHIIRSSSNFSSTPRQSAATPRNNAGAALSRIEDEEEEITTAVEEMVTAALNGGNPTAPHDALHTSQQHRAGQSSGTLSGLLAMKIDM